MLFTSLVFLFLFLPVLLLLYYAFPKKGRNTLLLLFSFLFYAWGGVSYAFVLVASIGVNYGFVNRINRSDATRKTWLYIGLTFNLILLVAFKYLLFFLENYNLLVSWAGSASALMPLPKILLPLGISFFTFQQMSLLWDVYREKQPIPLRLSDTALYISFFPQLIAGPIVRYNDIIQQIDHRRESPELFESGVKRFVLGLFRKVVIANGCAVMADNIMNRNTTDLSSPVAWLGLIAYAFQIYFDFSGYSDMAIGLGRMFGFRILENFNFPYIANSMQDFWRRWHISLSTWFRDYVYIPLGGNRKGSYRTYFNLLLVFLLTGFWHGASWNFMIWGLFHGLFLLFERAGFAGLLRKMPYVLRWGYSMTIVLISWVFFRIESLPAALSYVERLFVPAAEPQLLLIQQLDRERILILLLAILGSSPLPQLIYSYFADGRKLALSWVQAILMIIALLYSVMQVNAGSYNPFIYFRF